MFVDELTIYAQAGRGGDGVVRWRHEKGKEFSGPSGGDGGRGGSVYVRAVRDIGLLAKYRHQHDFSAEAGDDGAKNSMHGKNGDDYTIDVPVGSVISGPTLPEPVHLLEEGETVRLLRGGVGGYGNEHFKGSTNQRPMEWTPGKPGEEGEFLIELRLVVDAGFIGFPNAGKSSLLNELTNAGAKVGDYPFTTLDPNLGAFYGFVLADIPGLLEGASGGKGLGHKFLRHVRRTKLLVHCISLENEDVAQSYATIRNELKQYDEALLARPEMVVLTKTDLVAGEAVEKARASLPDGVPVFPTSIIDEESVKTFGDELVKLLRAQ